MKDARARTEMQSNERKKLQDHAGKTPLFGFKWVMQRIYAWILHHGILAYPSFFHNK